MSEEYDLIPHGKLKRLEEQIDELKHPGSRRSSSGPSSTGAMDNNAMQDLSESLKTMITVFTEAKDELRIEDEEKELLSNKIDPILKKLDSLLDQNEKIAEGILSLADMIRKVEGRIDSLESNDGSSSFETHENTHRPSQHDTGDAFASETFKAPSQSGMNVNSSPFGNQQQGFSQQASQGPASASSSPFANTNASTFTGATQASSAFGQASSPQQSGLEDPFGQPLQSGQQSQQSSPFGSSFGNQAGQTGQAGNMGGNNDMSSNNQPNTSFGGFNPETSKSSSDGQEQQPFGMPPPPPSPKKKGFFGK